MITLRPLFRLLFIVILLGMPHLLKAADIPTLTSLPLGERWYSVQMGGERVGFAHETISATEDGYLMRSEGSVKMVVMGFSRDASSKEWYLVEPDLTLKSFQVEQTIDGSRAVLRGEATPKGIRVTVESAGKKKEKTLKVQGAVYPPPALNRVPLMKGVKPGKKYKISIFDPEGVKVKRVTVTVEGVEDLHGSPAVHLKNDLYSFVENDIWVDRQGNSIHESVRDDLVVTNAEDEKSAKSYLTDAALGKKDLILDFSLIRVDTPIKEPERLTRLTVDFTGIPKDQPILQGVRQEGALLRDGATRFIMSATPPQGFQEAPPTPKDLEPGERIPSDAPEIAAQRDAILAGEKDPARKVELLVGWVAKEVKGAVTDSQSPLETLKTKSGNCQSHARLYAALARGAQVPTRFVSGVVYQGGHGFLYHSWAESYLEGKGWVPVDPTFGQVPADLTHIKLSQGDSPDDMVVLAGMIGKAKAKVAGQQYQ